MSNTEYINYQSLQLNSIGIDNAKNEIIWYLEHINIFSKKDLLFKKKISPKIKQAIDQFVKKRKQLIPFQYILNKCDFFGRDFIVDKRALIPRPETATIIDYLYNKTFFSNALEIGTGSGVISCSLSLNKIATNIISTDISASALTLAQENIKLYKIKNINLLEHNILIDLFDKKFDLIISNPPYISLQDYNNLTNEIKHYEPREALTDEKDGLIFYKRYAEIIKNILTLDGVFYCEIGHSSTCRDIEQIFQNNYTINWIEDLNNAPRFLELKRL